MNEFPKTVENLLRECIVRIDGTKPFSPGQPDFWSHLATGFFVTRRKLLTCSHCVRGFDPVFVFVPSTGETINVPQAQISYAGAGVDLALISFDRDIVVRIPFLNISQPEELPVESKLFAKGFTKSNPSEDSLLVHYVGTSQSPSGETTTPLLKVRGDKINKGMSGAPLFDLKIGKVVGVVTETESDFTPQGGYAIPITTALTSFPELRKEVASDFLFESRSIRPLEFNLQGPFVLFPLDNTPIDKIFIEPRYSTSSATSLHEVEYHEDGFILSCKEALQAQRILLILGGYGVGKTLCCRKLQSSLMDEGIHTVFLNCNRTEMLLRNIEHGQLQKQVLQDRADDQETVVFFDAYDELNYIDNDELQYADSFLGFIFRLSSLPGVSCVINSRKIQRSEAQLDDMWLLALWQNCGDGKDLPVFELQDFDNERVRKFQASYADMQLEIKARNPAGKANQNFYPLIPKDLLHACRTPLFLYWLCRSASKGGEQDLYTVYEEFVDKTVNGKFAFQLGNQHPGLGRLASTYREFLRALAVAIAEKHQGIKYTKDHVFGFVIDENTTQYRLIDSEGKSGAIKVRELVEKLAGTWLESVDLDRLTTNSLTCYFLENHATGWRFKDNNVLFFFIAELLYDFLKNLSNRFVSMDHEESFADWAAGELAKIQEVPIHPVVLEFVFKRLNRDDQGFREAVCEALCLLVRTGRIVQVTAYTLQKINRSLVRSWIFCGLTIIRLNSRPYTPHDIQYLFKRITWMLSALKRIDPNIHFLVRRFFKDCHIIDAEFRRINFGGYNFDNVQLTNVKFFQCKMDGWRARGAKFKEVEMHLCEINEADLSEFDGEILFSNSRVQNVQMTEWSQGSLVFDRCFVRQLNCSGDHASKANRLAIEFKRSHVEGVRVANLNARRVDMHFDRSLYAALEYNKEHVAVRLTDSRKV